jgi:hypothetical protein
VTVDMSKLTKKPPTLIQVRDPLQRTPPLTYDGLDFIRECVEDVWNTGPDGEDSVEVTNLPRWSVGWHKFENEVDCISWVPEELITGLVKEMVSDGMRIQCVVYQTSRTHLPPEASRVAFVWEKT